MRFFIMALALASLAAVAQAASPTSTEEYTCSSSFAPTAGIQGYTLTIMKTPDGATPFTGLLYPRCMVCRVQPIYLDFTHKDVNERRVLYVGPIPRRGPADKLRIVIEGDAPTRTFAAKLVTQKLNGAKPVDFTCVLP